MLHNNGQDCRNQHFCKGLFLRVRVLIAAAILADINPRKKYNQRMIIRFRPFVLQSKFDQSLLTGSWWGPLGAAETVLYMLSTWPLGILVSKQFVSYLVIEGIHIGRCPLAILISNSLF